MAPLGRLCLLLGLAICAFGIIAALQSARSAPGAELTEAWLASARRSIYALALVLTVAMGVLEAAFLGNDFAFRTVAASSSRSTPTIYRAAAIWASQEGSLLLWCWLMAIWSSVAVLVLRRRLRQATPYAIAILLALAAFFLALLNFAASPFATLARVPAEGAGLDPLLRFPTMTIHPPVLYSGYTLAMIPFAFGAGALIARRFDGEWLAAIRRFALAAWLFLGVGILLGARWSFSELGWGGYWGWDAVENASLMPWLTGTAFIHSIMVQEKRGMLKAWNAALMLATGILAVMGTFLVRSGVLDSIHAFGASTLGLPFVALIALMITGSGYLVLSRRTLLASAHRLDSLLSRESAFLANNIVLVGLCFVVFWGTYFPLISKLLTGQQASVGAPWFDRYTVPLALLLVALSGLGPVIPWRRASWSAARKHLRWPSLAALALLALLLAVGAAPSASALAMFTLGAFSIGVVASELARGTRVRMAIAGESPVRALSRLIGRNRRRHGGYLVHAGIAVLLIGVAGSSALAQQRERQLSVGQSLRVGPYTVRYLRPTAALLGGADRSGATLDLGALLEVRRAGRSVTLLQPTEGYYPGEATQGALSSLIGGQAVSHVAIDGALSGDVWSAVEPDMQAPELQRIVEAADRSLPTGRPEAGLVALALLARQYLRKPPPAQFNLIAMPLVEWIWLGGLLAAFGLLIAIWPAPLAARAARRVLAGTRRGALAGESMGGWG